MPFGIFATMARTFSVNVLILFFLRECGHLFPHRFAVPAIVAFVARSWQLMAVEAFLDIGKSFLNPRVVAFVRHECELEIEDAVESLLVSPRIGVHKISRIDNLEPVLTEEPLIYFHLPFVAVVPFLVQLLYLLVFARRFVIHNNELALGIDPYIIHAARDQKTGRLEPVLDAPPQGVTPLVHACISERHGIELVRFHERMRRLPRTVCVELFFEQRINGAVKIEGVSRRARGTKFIVYVETSLTFKKERYFRARKTPRRASIIPIRISLGFVEAAHSEEYTTSL